MSSIRLEEYLHDDDDDEEEEKCVRAGSMFSMFFSVFSREVAEAGLVGGHGKRAAVLHTARKSMDKKGCEK
jgi:hypothetical protein